MESGGSEPAEQALGKRLQQARRTAGLTQQTLCQRANLSYSTLTKIERGAIKSPSIFTIQSIAEALHVSLDDLVGFSYERPDTQTGRVTKSGVRFVYFDVNGCLVRTYHRAFSDLALRSGMPVDTVESLFWHYNDDVCRGIMSMDDFNAVLAERCGLDGVRWQDCYLAAVEPIAEMHEMVRYAAQYYPVGLVSNTMPGLLQPMIQQAKLPQVNYQSIVDSSEVGHVKPEPEIFQIAEERSGCAPNQLLLIDDTRGNLPVAESRGWHVLLFDPLDPEESVSRIKTALEPV